MNLQKQKPDAAASVAVIAAQDHAVLLIKRLHAPFQDYFAFPGGFLDVRKENLHQTAVRELFEETGLRLSVEDLRLIDVRSDPARDPRDHVIDVGFTAIIPKMIPLPDSTDETRPSWVLWSKVDKLDFAFDHLSFWQAIKRHVIERRLLETKSAAAAEHSRL